jgi:PAS domain S-box-containing protein
MEGKTMQVVTNRLPRYGIAVLSTAGASLFALLLSPLSLRVPFVLFAAAVAISSLQGGLKPGLLATALSAMVLTALYWLLPPTRLPENQGEAVPLLVLFVVVGLTSNYLGRQCWRAIHAVEWVQATLASFGDGLIFTDAQGQVTFINSAAHDVTGWTQRSVVPKFPERAAPARDGDECHPLERAIARVLGGDSAASVREPVETGNLLFSLNGAAEADAQAAPIRDREGSLLGAMVVLRNAPASQQKARDLRKRDEQFRALASCAPVGILQMDPECRAVYANCACQLSGGFSADDALGEGWTRFLHPDDHEQVVPAWTAAMQAGTEFACEFRFQTPDQRGRWVRLRSSPMYSDVGKVIGHVGVLDDIDEQKAAEEALQETRILLSAVAESCADALFVNNTQGRCLWANTVGARMVSRTIREIIGKEEDELFAAAGARHLREPGYDSDPLPSDNQRAYITRKTPFQDFQGNIAGLITVCRDVTEENRFKTDLVKANAATALEAQTRQRTEEDLRHCQARLQSCDEQAACLTRVTSLLQDETAARQQTEERLREALAQVHAGETQVTELAKAKTVLQEAVQAAERSAEERTTELANVKASLEQETAGRRRAEKTLEECQGHVQVLTERVTELENVKSSLEQRLNGSRQATEPVRQENESIMDGSADALLNGSAWWSEFNFQ